MNRKPRMPIATIILASVLMLLLPAVASAQPEKYMAGTNYTVLEKPVRTRDASKVEVVEVFWYGCGHCYHFEPLIKQWHSRQGETVDFWQSPAMWNGPMKTHAQMYFTAQALGVSDKLHDAIFTAMNVENKRMVNPQEIEDFFAGYGVDRAAFNKAFKSFSVTSQVKQAEARARAYKISGTPEMVVNGKYRVDARLAGGQAQMLEVVDFLVAKEQAALAAK